MDRFNGFAARFEELDRELEYAKEHSFEVKLEFDRRFRVWDTILLRNRKFHVGSLWESPDDQQDLLHRYISLDLKDTLRLIGRAYREFFTVANDIHTSGYKLIFAKNLLWQRVKHVEDRIVIQFTQYEIVTGAEILHVFKNGWKELVNAKYGKYSVSVTKR